MSYPGNSIRYELAFLVEKLPHLDKEGLRIAALRIAALAYRGAAELDYALDPKAPAPVPPKEGG